MLIRAQTQASSNVCLQCRQAVRTFSTTRTQQVFGPEHPRYIDVPEPPQQTSYKPEDVKGILPVPRPLFTGKRGIRERRERSIVLSTQTKQLNRPHEEGTYDAWKTKVSEQRKQNLREGTKELRRRHDQSNARRDQVSRARVAERNEAVLRPEREDERLTASSHNFDLDSLMRGEVLERDAEARFASSKRQYLSRERKKTQERMDHLHTLYTKATKFIVTTQQLDDALETAFGTDANPVLFGREAGVMADEPHSIWAEGIPEDAKSMLQRISAITSKEFVGPAEPGKVQGGASIDQVAEVLTGGALGERNTKARVGSVDLFRGL